MPETWSTVILSGAAMPCALRSRRISTQSAGILRLACSLRMTLLCLFGMVPGLGFADDLLGTKADPISSAANSGSTVGIMPMLQMLLALGIVLVLLKFALPKLIGKFGKKMVTKLDGGVTIEESANFPGGTLYVVTARSKTLLVSVAASGVACLADLTEPAQPEPPTFQEMVDQAVVYDEQPEPPDLILAAPPNTDAQRALDRLRRLAG